MLIPYFDDPTAMLMKLPEKIRWRIVQVSPIAVGCWLWTGPLHYHGRANCEDGYGRQSWPRDPEDPASGAVNWLAHRLTYTLLVAPIEPGLVLDHHVKRCKVRRCVRPDHCEPVTYEVNTMRGNGYYLFGLPHVESDEPPF